MIVRIVVNGVTGCCSDGLFGGCRGFEGLDRPL